MNTAVTYTYSYTNKLADTSVTIVALTLISYHSTDVTTLTLRDTSTEFLLPPLNGNSTHTNTRLTLTGQYSH